MYTAGTDMNVAIGLSRLEFNSYFAAQFGNDPIGKFVENHIRDKNI